MNPFRLFAFYLGGDHPRAKIELHDVQFVVARSVMDAVPALKALWWGTPGSLHIDAYAEILRVGGYAVRPVPAPAPKSDVSLFFVNAGGYKPAVFGELHDYSFHIGADKKAVWAAAKARAQGFRQLHQDNFERIDDVVCVDDAVAAQGWGLAFDPEDGPDEVRIAAEYVKLSG